jgi:hypothetical protein
MVTVMNITIITNSFQPKYIPRLQGNPGQIYFLQREKPEKKEKGDEFKGQAQFR